MPRAFEKFQRLREMRRWRDVKSLMAGAQLFIGNDSGPAHIAAAFGVPVVVIFGAVESGDLGAVAHRSSGADVRRRNRARSRRTKSIAAVEALLDEGCGA